MTVKNDWRNHMTPFEKELNKIQRNAYLLARSDIDGDHPRGIEILDDIFFVQIRNLFKDKINELIKEEKIYCKKGYHDVDEFYK